MRAMNEAQYKIVKTFLDGFKIPPKKLWQKWTKLGVAIELHEIYRVYLCHSYIVYKNDEIADEDVMLAMEGLGR